VALIRKFLDGPAVAHTVASSDGNSDENACAGAAAF